MPRPQRGTKTTLSLQSNPHDESSCRYATQPCWLRHPSGKAINVAEKDKEDDYADADETRAESLSLEEENLAKDLAGEEETRQNAFASTDADWLTDEAAANMASTTIAALATSSFLAGLVSADVAYVTAAAPLVTSARMWSTAIVDVSTPDRPPS
ncbi:MAG: hypothetical protein HQ518_00125 [Rhodopirellula sp.]|nr:hypothetical protein [Rhodopirellula sp.]